MDTPLLLADNVFNTRLYPNHVLSAEEEATGFPVERIANGRRHSQDYWTPTTANSPTFVRCVFDRARAFNCIVVDKNSNLLAETVQVNVSNDGFTTSDEVFSLTIPASSTPGKLDDPTGVVLEDGSWAHLHDLQTSWAVEFAIDAMGAGELPQIGGLWIGLAYQFDRQFDDPWSDSTKEFFQERSVSDYGWKGLGPPTPAGVGTMGVRLPDVLSYDDARLHIEGMFGSGVPSWLFYDQAQADRGLCVLRADGTLGFDLRNDWWNRRRAEVRWEEHQPSIL